MTRSVPASERGPRTAAAAATGASNYYVKTAQAVARRSALRKVTAAKLSVMLASSVCFPLFFAVTPAHAAVTVGGNISVFPNRDMVVVSGYDLGEELKVDVLRNDVIIGTTTGEAWDTPDGAGLEINHGVEGDPAPGDCWTGVTPDIVGGDVIRVTTPRGEDSSTVVDVDFTGAPYVDDIGDVVVEGTAPEGADFAVEFRRDKPVRFRAGPLVPEFTSATTWRASYTPTASQGFTAEEQRDLAANEADWSAVADAITETTLAELGAAGGVAAGCSGSNDPNAVAGGLDPVNIASGDVTFSGTAREGVTAVDLKVGSLESRLVNLSGNATGVKTWSLMVPKSELAGEPDGLVKVTPSFDGAAGVSRTLLKDTVAPLPPSASPAAGVYATKQDVKLSRPNGEGAGKIRWEMGDAGVADPNEFSDVYTSLIPVSSSQTIKARFVDAAGNPGAVATLDYQIGFKTPGAPTIGGVEADDASVTVTWEHPASNGGTPVTGYVVRTYAGNTVVSTSAPVDNDQTSFTVTGLTNGKAYSFDVRAVNGAGTSVASARSAVATPATVPARPTFGASTAGNASVTLRWNAPANGGSPITGYRIDQYTGASGTVSKPTSVGDVTSHLVTGLTNGSSYSFTVTAINAKGEAVSARSAALTPRVEFVAPTVTARGPAANATTVSAASNVTATFSEAVAGVGATSVSLRAGTSASGALVPAGVTYNATTRTVTLNPNANLAADTRYTVRLTGGATAIRDAAGNPLASTSWSFLTGPAPTVRATTPATNATKVRRAANITATFSEAMAGVSGSSFTLRLGTSTTGRQITGTVSYNATTNVATLNPGVTLAANTKYTVRLIGSTSLLRDKAGNPLATRTFSFTTGTTS